VLPLPFLELREGINVVRDDMIPGGTKRRFVDAYVHGAAKEFVYASPAYGGAQIALAMATREAGKRCTIFVAKRSSLHARTKEAQAAGARIVEVANGYLSNVQSKARAYAAESGAHLMPFGFDTPEAHAAIAAAARSVLERFPHPFAEVWSVAGSGVLTRGLQAAGLGLTYWAVAVGRENPDVGKAHLISHGQPFEADARIRPPFPSCSNYDAKAWSHIKARHPSPLRAIRSRVLFWNVMG
jgi:hypothetical protein